MIMDLVAPDTLRTAPAPTVEPTAQPAPKPTAAAATAPTPASAPDTTPTDDAAPPTGIAFKPVGNEGEVQPGGTLMVEAYAAIWVIVLGFVIVSFLRTRALGERVQTLEAAMGRLDRARAKAPPPKAESAIEPAAAAVAED